MSHLEQSAGLPPAIFIMGPTASGKTDLAIALCEHLPCELISVDSALIYQGMDIGTAKPTADELARAPHALIDIRDPAESYSAADFRRDALQQMAAITARGNIPVLVGGTMLYYKALLEGLSQLPKADPKVRAEIERQAAEQGWEALHRELAQIDPEAAARIHPNDPQRLSRALEVYRVSGETMTALWAKQQQDQLQYNVVQFAIAPSDRSVLRERIRQRFLLMLEQGFEDEVRQLRARGDLHLDLPSMRCVGYRQMWQYLCGELDHDEMIYRGVVATAQLAKRQITWLRGWKHDLTWLESGDPANLERVLAVLGSAGIVEA